MIRGEEVLGTIQTLPATERREIVGRILRDFVASDGRDAALQLMFTNVFGEATQPLQAEVETLAAFGRLPKDRAEALLAPFDPATVNMEDCLADDEVERILSSSARGR